MKISLFLLTAGLAMTGSAGNAAPDKSGVEAHIREVHARAMAGDANAQAELGAIYAFGEGVPKDLLRGLIWFDVADASGAPVGETPYMVDYLVRKGTGAVRRPAGPRNRATDQENQAGGRGRSAVTLSNQPIVKTHPRKKPSAAGNLRPLSCLMAAGLALIFLSPRARSAELGETAKLIRAEVAAHQPYNIPPIGLEMRPIPAGSFVMGSPSDEPGRDTEGQVEEPLTHVTISKPFWLGRTVVTVGQWRKLMGTTLPDQVRKALADDTVYNFGGNVENFKPAQLGTIRQKLHATRDTDPNKFLLNTDDNLPMVFTNWFDAMDFCRKLNEQGRRNGTLPSGYQYTLPTEAQWEYACRAGTATATYNGPLEVLGLYNAPVLDPIGWYGGNSNDGYQGKGADASKRAEKQYPGDKAGPRDVALKQPNAWGLYDMLGNVWQICRDSYTIPPGGSVTDPVGKDSGCGVVGRGGSWTCQPMCLRSARRDGDLPGYRGINRSFRIALCPKD